MPKAANPLLIGSFELAYKVGYCQDKETGTSLAPVRKRNLTNHQGTDICWAIIQNAELDKDFRELKSPRCRLQSLNLCVSIINFKFPTKKLSFQTLFLIFSQKATKRLINSELSKHF